MRDIKECNNTDYEIAVNEFCSKYDIPLSEFIRIRAIILEDYSPLEF